MGQDVVAAEGEAEGEGKGEVEGKNGLCAIGRVLS